MTGKSRCGGWLLCDGRRLTPPGLSLEKRDKDEGIFSRYSVFHGGDSEGCSKTHR
jgi:hypothetical protein